MSKDITKYITTREAAEMLGVNRFWIVRLIANGKIKAIKKGYDWFVFTPSLEKYLTHKSKRGRPPSKPPKIKVESKDQDTQDDTNDGQG